MELKPEQKLQRFCVIGSFAPIYNIYKADEIEVAQVLPELEKIYSTIEFVPFIRVIKETLKQKTIPRPNEVGQFCCFIDE